MALITCTEEIVKRIRSALLILTMASGCAYGQSIPGFAIKQFTVGMSELDLRKGFSTELSCDGGPTSPKHSCRASRAFDDRFKTVAGARVKVYYFTLYQDSLELIQLVLPTVAFADVVAGLKDKYGEPTSTLNLTVQSRCGAELSDTHHYWKRDGQELIVWQRFGQIDDMAITVKTERVIAEETAQAAARRKDI